MRSCHFYKQEVDKTVERDGCLEWQANKLRTAKSREMNCIMAIEEMAELTKEVTKLARGYARKREWLIEEIADVEISLAILMDEFDVSRGEVDEEVGRKMNRNLKRMKEV